MSDIFGTWPEFCDSNETPGKWDGQSEGLYLLRLQWEIEDNNIAFMVR